GYFAHRRPTRRLLEHTDLSEAAMRAALFATPLEHDYETGRITSEQFLREVRELCGFRCPVDELAAAWADIFQPNHEVCALIPVLKDRYPLLLGSNTNDLHARQFCRQFADTLRHFRHLVLSHQVGTRKPHLAFFEHCVERAERPASECLFIDDLAANVEAARRVGLEAIVYKDCEDLLAQFRRLGISFQWNL